MTLIDIFLNLTSKLAGIYIAILIGIVWRFSRFYSKKYADIFTQIVIWIFFPITIITAIISLDQTFSPTIIIGIFLLATILHFGSYFGMLGLITIRKREIHGKAQTLTSIGSQANAAVFPNFVFYPFPIIIALVGSDGLIFATFFTVFTMVFRNTLGVYLGLSYGATTQKNNQKPLDSKSTDIGSLIKQTIWEMIKFPPFFALLVGFVLLFVFGPQQITSSQGVLPGLIELAKNASMVLSLILIGLSFQSIDELKPRQLFSRKTLEVGVIRFVLSPLLVAFVLFIWEFPAIAAAALIIQCVSPPAVSNIIYAEFFHLDVSEIATYITSLTLFSLVILPFEVTLLQLIFLN